MCKSRPKTQTSNQYTNVYRRTRFKKKYHWWTTYIFAAIGWRSVEKLAYSRRRMILLYWGIFLKGNIRSCMFDELLIQERKKQYKCALRGGECNRREQEEHKSSKVPGGTLLYKRYRYMPPPRVWFQFCAVSVYRRCLFWSGIGMVFEETTWVYERIYRFNSKWVKEKCANSKWILRNLFVSVLI